MSLGSHYSPPLKRLQCARFDVGLPLNYDLSTTCFLDSDVADLLVCCNAAGCNAADYNAVDCNAADRTAADFHSNWCSHFLFCLTFATDCVFRLTSHSAFSDFSVCSDFFLMLHAVL